MVVKKFVMLNHLLLILVAARALAQKPAIDTGTLIDVFGTPPTTSKTSTVSITPLPLTPSTTPLVLDKGGETCTCVPYYLCDANLVAVFKNNVTVTGWGELDIRFGENECQESVERCCKEPKDESAVIVPVTPAPLKGCGYRNRDGLDFTIKGGSGSEALFGEFPWVAALLNNDNQSYAGVGVLIHPQVVMTGAHIAHKYQAGGLTARLGEWDTHTTKERLRHQERSVVEISVHPEFRSLSLQSDVALLRLESPVELASHINVLCLPEQDESFQTSRGCVANGWGKDEFGDKGRFAVIMKRVELNMVESALCDSLLKRTKLGPKFRLHETFLCAGGEEGKDTCQGDGGAPLACPIGGDRYKLTGLVAWGISCGQRDVPAVYVNVAKFRRWVDAKMREWGYDTSGYSV